MGGTRSGRRWCIALVAGHDQRMVAHDAQAADYPPYVAAHRRDVKHGVVDPGILPGGQRPGLVAQPLPEFREWHQHRGAPSDAPPLQCPVQQPGEHLVIKRRAHAAAPHPGLDGHPVPFVLAAARERHLPVVCREAVREVPGDSGQAAGYLRVSSRRHTGRPRRAGRLLPGGTGLRFARKLAVSNSVYPVPGAHQRLAART